MPKWARVSLIIVLVIIGFVLPSVRPAGRSLLVWVQLQFLRLSAIGDRWREPQTPINGGHAKVTDAARTAAGKPAGSPPKAAGENAPGCRASEDVLATIPHREHYQMLSECVTVAGTVRSEPHSDPDGVQFSFDVAARDSHLFAPQVGGVETGQRHEMVKPVVGLGIIVPADLPGCRPGGVIKRGRFDSKTAGVCSGLNVVVPMPGTRVKITGAFVFDQENKLHVVCPVWSITPLYD